MTPRSIGALSTRRTAGSFFSRSLKPSIWSFWMSTKKYDGATSGRLPAMALRRLPSIWPTAASTDRPSPNDNTVEVAPSRGPEIAASAHRNAGRPCAMRAPRREVQRITHADSASSTSAPAMPPAIHNVSRHVPENSPASPTSNTSPAPTATT